MSTNGTNGSVTGTEPSVADEATPVRELSEHVHEGVGVFRALLRTALLYVALGFLIWFAWHAWGHWHTH